MKRLITCDTTGRLKHFVYLFELSSKDTQTMQHIIHQADVVCVWGGEEAVKSVRAMTPSSIRFVDWGHKISFAYFANSVKEDTSLIEDLAKDICKRNQQACTSPQCVLVEVDDNAELDAFGEKLGAALEKVQHDFIELVPSVQEQAELTTITHLQHIEEAEGWGRVIVSPEFRYRILVDYRSGLQPSPLFRTIWVKPVKRKEIVSVLRPFNLYLQTCGLASGNLQEAYQLTDLLIKAGVERITEVGHQHEAYVGEPHDGVYALQRYTKRVGVRYPSHQVKGVPNFTYLQNEHHLRNLTDLPVTNKEQRQEAVNPSAKMYLKSGGSSGTTKIAGYSWEDWEAQISVMAESFMIGGLQPSDRCAILFSAGNLYGGLIATQKALEHIKASSFTIGSNTDIRTIAENILAVKPNVIMGMPSFLRKLFREEYDLLKQHTGFEKIYYGGELMTEEQKEWFKTNFGFQTITSPVYASNDALINGYACEYCDNGEFHVPTKVMDLEIVHKETNEPVSEDEIGRVLITLRSIKDPALTRYEIGDLAKWISTPCSCGHATPKFKLMGRTGDLVRCGAKFINFREIVKVLNEQCGYTDSVQMQIETSASAADLITIKVLEQCAGREEEIKQTLLNKITDLAYAVKQKNADLIISALPISAFDIAAASGKVRPIVDLRIQN